MASVEALVGGRRRRGVQLKDGAFEALLIVATLVGIATLFVLIAAVLQQGLPWLDTATVFNQPSADPDRAGVWGPLVGSLWIMGITAGVAFPVGVGAAIYLTEYAPDTRFWRLVRVNVANLAAVPSIVYGILGLAFFVRLAALGRSVAAGGLTMAILVLPIVIIASREAMLAVPSELRHGALGLGATRWRTTSRVVLPAAMPGILTGTILSLSRAIGETAPLILAGAVAYVTSTPTSLSSSFTVLPLQVFDWASRPQPAFRSGLAGAAIVILLTVLLTMNAGAILLRNRLQDRG
ncbi:MAG: phosphate ABC transporter permease PstA [Actinobacteria bacterium]|nr:phosphate ABC transporter permease PstA [Actinomycetota bacterium]